MNNAIIDRVKSNCFMIIEAFVLVFFQNTTTCIWGISGHTLCNQSWIFGKSFQLLLLRKNTCFAICCYFDEREKNKEGKNDLLVDQSLPYDLLSQNLNYFVTTETSLILYPMYDLFCQCFLVLSNIKYKWLNIRTYFVWFLKSIFLCS